MITISYGAQFRNGKATGLFLLFVLFGAFSVASFVQGRVLIGFTLLVLAVLLCIFTFDFKGVEIDLEKNLYRIYTITVIGKRGKWQPYEGFEKITVKYDSFKINTASFGGGRASSVTENHSRFVIELEHSTGNKGTLFIREEQKYNDALNYAHELSKKLSLPVRDYFGEKLARNGR